MDDKGFTLIELMIVVAIAAILVSLVAQVFGGGSMEQLMIRLFG